MSKTNPKYHIGDQFILTITGLFHDPEKDRILYECNQFTDYPLLEEVEVDNMIPVDKDTRSFTSGYRVGYKDGFADSSANAGRLIRKLIGEKPEEEEDDSLQS